MGSHALGIGAMMAGCRYFAGYPITPQTELLEYLSQVLPEHGGVFQQLGDELSSVMAVFGAAVAGQRAMTASVGPGLTLMIDGLTNAAGAEVPFVLAALTGRAPCPRGTELAVNVDDGDIVVFGVREWDGIDAAPIRVLDYPSLAMGGLAAKA